MWTVCQIPGCQHTCFALDWRCNAWNNRSMNQDICRPWSHRDADEHWCDSDIDFWLPRTHLVIFVFLFILFFLVDWQLGQKAVFLCNGSSHLISSPPVSQQHYTSTEAAQCHITTRSSPSQKPLQAISESWCKHFFSAVKTRAGCYCKAPFLVSNPLLQFSQWRLHLSLTALALPCIAPLQFLFTHKHDTPRNDSACREAGREAGGRAAVMSCVYLGDLNPAGTGERWGSHSPSWGPTAAEIARPCRRRPCRQPWETTRRRSRRRWRRRRRRRGGSWLHRVFTQHGGAAGGLLVVGAESLRSSSPGDGSLEGGGAPRWSPPPRPSLTWPGAEQRLWSGAPHTGDCKGIQQENQEMWLYLVAHRFILI